MSQDIIPQKLGLECNCSWPRDIVPQWIYKFYNTYRGLLSQRYKSRGTREGKKQYVENLHQYWFQQIRTQSHGWHSSQTWRYPYRNMMVRLLAYYIVLVLSVIFNLAFRRILLCIFTLKYQTSDQFKPAQKFCTKKFPEFRLCYI